MNFYLSRFFLCILLMVLVLPAKAEIIVIPQGQVREYVLSLFSTPEVHKAATTPGNRISNLVDALSKNPLFIDVPDANDKIHRENFTAFVGVLNVRTFRNKTAIINDLYFIHELLHVSQMPYQDKLTHREWAKKMAAHEQDISFQTEFAVFFEFPEFRPLMNIESIYADRFLNDPKIKAIFAVNPEEAYAIISKIKNDLQSSKPITNLTDMEFRSWYYGRTMELWADIYSPIKQRTENHMLRYYEELKVNPAQAIANHLRWLKANSKDGTLFKDRLLEYIQKTRTMFPTTRNGALINRFTTSEFCAACERYSEKFRELIENQQIEMTPLVPVAKNLLKQGVAATVYSYVFPESERIFDEVLATFNYQDTYGEAFTRKQDSAHKEFIAAYKTWVNPVVKGLDGYTHSYPSNGSSEALKDTLGYLKGQNPAVTLHVFYGEYDGPIEYAKGLSMKIVKHERTLESIKQIKTIAKSGDLFYLSQPSGIDGNVWPDYDKFIKEMEKTDIKVLVDLAYVGLVPHPYKVNVSSKSIVAVFFSLSKSFGVYYQRIGGAFFRFPNPMLYGNMWFKNLLSLKIGTKLLKSFGVYELARRYQWTQTASINQFNLTSGLNMQPSDVILLAVEPIQKSELNKLTNSDYPQIYRGSDNEGYLRVSLTPSISTFVELNTQMSCKRLFE